MRKMLVLVLSILLLISVSQPAAAAEQEYQNTFVLTAVSANASIISPEYIPYEPGQTIQEALLASEHDFVGLEQGFIYEIDGRTANFHMFYDGNGYDLSRPASDITVLCIGVTSEYSENLLALIRKMAEYRVNGNVQQYGDAVNAFLEGQNVIRNGDAAAAEVTLNRLEAAMEAYEAVLNGQKYTVTVSASQNGTHLANPVVTLTDAYGNKTSAAGTTLSVIAGDYSFSVSDGGYNRTEGSLTVSGDTTLTTVLPAGEWFGDVKILDAKKNPYPYVQNKEDHSAVYQIPDVAKEINSLYLNVGMGNVPDREATRLRTIYLGTNLNDFSNAAKSWESIATALTYLVQPGMEGIRFPLEAQYTDSNGHTQIQSYDITVERTPTLKSLKVVAEGTVLPVEFAPETYSYNVTTVSDHLDISAEPFGAGYTVTGTGTAELVARHTVTVSANGKTTEYQLNITRKASVPVKMNVPAGVSVLVMNAAGSEIAPVDGTYHLIPGASYTYLATKNRVYHTTASFTAQAGLTVAVAAPDAEDWLQDLALYDGSNADTRITYASDSSFAGNDHSYVYYISDCNTSAYIQATSDYTVNAKHVTQTTSESTNGVEKNTLIDLPVGKGKAKILTNIIAKSGYSNTCILRIANTSGTVTYYQDYTLTLARKLHITEFSAKVGDDSPAFLNAEGKVLKFDRDTTDYHVTVNRDIEEIKLNATFPNVLDTTDCCGGYYALINGKRYDTVADVAVSLDSALDSEVITLRVCHVSGDAVPTDYTLTVNKTDPVEISFETDPADAVVFLINDLNGKRILPENGVYKLTPGGSYTYTVTSAGYVGTKGTYVAPSQSGTFAVSLSEAPRNTALKQLDSYWPHLRRNSNNNGVIDAPTPIQDEDAVLYWATKIGDGYDKNACGCPILVDGYLYTYAGSTIYKVDTVTGAIVAMGAMDHASSYAINPPTYADGMLFVGLADGSVQAFNAATLESLWIYRDPLKGQPNCSIIYHDGYVYTGFWVGEDKNANYVCLNATDEDPTKTKEEKLATWSYTSKGGFYWGGAYVCDDFLLIGTDDGESGYTRGKASLLSFHPRTGELLDAQQMDVVGDIRCSITADNGKYYFTNKGGYFFEATVSGNGEIEEVKKLKLNNYADMLNSPPMSTSTPTVYNGRAYVGVSGTNQFGAYSGHNITVIDIRNWEIAYKVRTQGYPQTSGVLTTAYEGDGSVYVYFFDNYTPGKLRMLEDKPGQTRASVVTRESYTDKGTTTTYDAAYALFTPYDDQAQYAICSPIMDENGTIYFKNDSAYLMAVGSAVAELEITRAPDKMTYKTGETFDHSGMRVTARYVNGLEKDVTNLVVWSEDPLTEDDTDFQIEFPVVMYQNKDGEAGVEYQKPFAVLQITVEGDSVTYGDVGNDGNVDMEDVSVVLQRINGSVDGFTDQQTVAADVNGDRNLDMNDVSLILQRINGSIAQFPVEVPQEDDLPSE